LAGANVVTRAVNAEGVPVASVQFAFVNIDATREVCAASQGDGSSETRVTLTSTLVNGGHTAVRVNVASVDGTLVNVTTARRSEAGATSYILGAVVARKATAKADVGYVLRTGRILIA